MNNSMLSNIEGVLSRGEMKLIMAGSGNIYCSSGSQQVECNFDDLVICTDVCVLAWGDNCHGCAQFPNPEPEEHP